MAGKLFTILKNDGVLEEYIVSMTFRIRGKMYHLIGDTTWEGVSIYEIVLFVSLLVGKIDLDMVEREK